MCAKHYHRWQRHGDTSVVHPHGWRGKSPEERFWAKVNKNGPVPEHRPDLGSCWEWTAALTNGYGAFGIASTPDRPNQWRGIVRAHRFSYELLIGPIPDGLDIDHLCRNTVCVRVTHLEAVPHRINIRRGISPAAQHARKDACPEGHPYDMVESGRGTRRCSICKNRRARERWLAKLTAKKTG